MSTPLLLSKSRINTYCQCPEKFRLTYIEKIIPEKMPTAMIEGSALHHIVENSLVYGNVIDDIAEVASQEYWSTISLANTEYASNEHLQKAQKGVLEESRDFLRQIGVLHTYQMESYFEHHLIHPVTGEVDESILLRGYADIIDAPQKDVIRIIDIKTSARTPSHEQAHRALELTIYAYLAACAYGFHIEMPVALLYLVRNRNRNVVWLESSRNQVDFLHMYTMIQTIASGIRQNLFWQNQGIHCSWCCHQNICFGQKG